MNDADVAAMRDVIKNLREVAKDMTAEGRRLRRVADDAERRLQKALRKN